MEVIVIFLSMLLLIYIAYRGWNMILFAPLVALAAILLSEPPYSLPLMNVFMEKMADFIKLYFLTFLLGGLFGKLMELSGSAHSLSKFVIRHMGRRRAILALVLIGAMLTYGGVSAFVAVFALYPFAMRIFREADIPRRIMPAVIVLGAFGFSTSTLPGSPQIQNIIPTSFYHTDTWAAPWLGLAGGLFVLVLGVWYLEWRRALAARAGERFDEREEAVEEGAGELPHPLLALLPLLLVAFLNKGFTVIINRVFGDTFDFSVLGLAGMSPIAISSQAAIWSVEIALLAGISATILINWKRLKERLTKGIHDAVTGTISATLTTATQYGYGGVIQALPGFAAIQLSMSRLFDNPLVNEAVTANLFAGMTGSASGGLSVALATSGQTYLDQALRLGIDPEVLHRVASMAGSGLDTLPHNGAVLTILAITGLTHRQAYREVLGLTLIKAAAPFLVIALYYVFR